MLHLIKYNILVKLRNFNMTFWPLVFPLILGTFFFFAFGNLNDADFETVQVALVRETTSNPLFDFYLEQVQLSDSDLINIHELTEQKALAALKNREISGIYYTGMTPSLTINAHGIPESILQSILESYNNSLHTIRTILKKHPPGPAAPLKWPEGIWASASRIWTPAAPRWAKKSRLPIPPGCWAVCLTALNTGASARRRWKIWPNMPAFRYGTASPTNSIRRRCWQTF